MTVRRVTLSEYELEEMLARAAKAGAHEVLTELGLFDEEDRLAPARDIKDLRDLLRVLREIQTDALKGALAWVGKGFMALLFIGLAVWVARSGALLEIGASPK